MVWLSVNISDCTYITGELSNFGRISKLWSLTEVNAVAFGVLQVFLILHLQKKKEKKRSGFQQQPFSSYLF